MEKPKGGEFLVWCLGLHAFTAKGVGSVPVRGTRIPQAVCHSQKKEKRKLAGARSASRASGSLWSQGRRLEGSGDSIGGWSRRWAQY